jgi:hypothetical protein
VSGSAASYLKYKYNENGRILSDRKGGSEVPRDEVGKYDPEGAVSTVEWVKGRQKHYQGPQAEEG